MNIMSSYFDISLENWQQLARTACSALDQNDKERAEKLFFDFTEAPDINLVISLINNGSNCLVFVIFSYLSKNYHTFGKNLSNFTDLMAIISSWQFVGLNFVRNNHQIFEPFVARTIMSAIGIFLKYLYQNQMTSASIIQYLNRIQANYFKLYILKTFIEAIEAVDNEMGYMRFRTMIYNFQDNIIPMVCETLMPFFYSIEEGVRMSELNLLQQQLQVNQNGNNQRSNRLNISKQQQMHAEYVFMLLKKIVEFNYNITYTEYQSELVIDTCLITFPDKVLEKIINYQFINALFFIVEKISEAKEGLRKSEYMSIALDCIAKMMQSRLTYISEENKERYLQHSIKGLVHLLKKCQQIGSEVLLQGILICNKKLFINVELSYIKTVLGKDQLLKKSNLYQIYINELTKIIVLVVQQSFVNVDNHLLSEAIELGNKIVISYGYREQEKMDQESNFFMEFAKAVIDGFLGNLCQPKYIFQNSKIVSIGESKLLLNQLFDLFKKMASYNYEYFFEKLQQGLDYFINNAKNQIVIFANILFLLTEIVDHHYLDRNLYLAKAKDSEVCILGEIVKKATYLIRDYLQTKRVFNNKQSSYIDLAVILFTQAIMLQFLMGFQAGTNNFKITRKLYTLMMYGEHYHTLFQPEQDQSEQTILTYLKMLFEYLNCQVQTGEEEIKMLYCLDVIEKGIFKLKWNMKREVFTKTSIFKYLYTYFQNFFYNFKVMMDIRSRVAKIMVTLTFDDVLDEFKFRINNFITILKSQEMLAILYDLIGIFEGIQTNAISKYFCNRLRRQIDLNAFFSQLFEHARNLKDQKFYKDICRLIKSIVINKGLKITNSSLVYQLFKMLMPHLIRMLKDINKTNPINMDLWGQSIFQILEMFNGVINGTHINIFLFDHYTKTNSISQLSLFKQFIIQFLTMIVIITSNMRTYPKMQDSISNTLVSINKEILDYIYDDEMGDISGIYNVATIKLVDFAIDYINIVLNGNKIIEDKLIKAIDCLRTFYSFFNKRCKMTHKATCIKNLQKYYELSEKYIFDSSLENKNEKLIFYLISFILTNNKNNATYLRTITKLIYELNRPFNHYIINSLYKLKVNEQDIQKATVILKDFETDSEQTFVERFKNWIKQFK